MNYFPKASVKHLFLFCALLFISSFSFGQDNSVAIGSTSVNAKAVLMLVSPNDNQGLMIPVVSSRANIGATAAEEGMIVYDNSDNKVYYHNGASWLELGGGTGGGDSYSLRIQGSNLELLANGLAQDQIALSNFNVITVGGDLSGTIANSTVTDIQGNPIDATALAGADAGKVLQWDGAQWVATTLTGGVTYTAGTGIDITSGVITNTGDTNATNEIQNLSLTGTTLNISSGTSVDLAPIISSGTETDPTVKAITGLVKSNGTTISAATAGTDYLAPNGNGSALTNLNAANVATGTLPTARLDVGINANQIVQIDGTGKLPAIDGSQLTNLPAGTETDPTVKAITGLVKSNGTTISAAVAGTDYLASETDPTVKAITGLVKSNGTTISAAVAGTDYLATETDPTVKVITGLVKSDGTTISAATAGTDYLAPNGNGSALTNLNAANVATGTLPTARLDVGINANQIVQIDGTGKLPAIDGSQLTNLPAGTETDPTVKAITGLVKSNGTTISAAVAGTDYLATETDPTVKAITGLVKSDGTTISAATAGTDYLAPNGNGSALTNLNAANVATGTLPTARLDVGINANQIVQIDGTGKLPAIDGSQLTNLPAGTETDPTVKAITGLVKSNGTTISAAVAGTDYLATETDPTVKAITGLVKSNGTTISAAVAGTDYLVTETDPTVKAITGLVKSDGTTISAAVAGTDYLATETDPTVKAITGLVKSNGTTISAAVAGTDYLATETDPTVKAITGLVKSDGTTISAAVAGTDYLATVTTDATTITGDGSGTPLTVPANAITSTQIADGAISGGTGGKLTDLSVTDDDIANSTITTGKLAPSAGTPGILATDGATVSWLTEANPNKVLGTDAGGNMVFRNVIDAGTGISDPGTDANLVTEAAVRAAISGATSLQGAYDGGKTIQLDGTNDFTISNSGTIPVMNLDDNGTLRLGNAAASINGIKLQISDNNTSTAPMLHIQNANNAGDASLRFWQGAAAIPFAMGIDANDGFFKIANGNEMGINNRLVINDLGYIGIGNSAPASDLHIGAKTHLFELGGASLVLSNNVSKDLTLTTAAEAGYLLMTNGGTIKMGNTSLGIPSAGTDVSGSLDEWLVMQSDGVIKINSSISLPDDDNSNTVHIQSPANITSDYKFVLPPAGGTVGQLLSTDGAGNTSWTNAGAAPTLQNAYEGINTMNISAAEGNLLINNADGSVPYLTVLEASGNVGIGLTNPTVKLMVQDDANGANPIAGIWSSDAAGDVGYGFRSNAGTGYVMGIDQSDGESFKISNGAALGSNDRMVIDAAGNVGVGTNAPVTKFHVNSGAAATVLTLDNTVAGNTIMAMNNNGSLAAQLQATSTATNLISASTRDINLYTNGVSRLNVDGSTGYVGINTDSPAGIFEVRESFNGDATFRVEGRNVSVGDFIGGGSNAYMFIDGEGNGDFELINGNVGIGTTSPDELLVVGSPISIGHTYNTITAGNSAGGGGAVVVGNSGASYLFMEHGATFGSRIKASDDIFVDAASVGIGVNGAVNKLDVEGGVAIGATYSGTSTAPTNGLLVQGNVGIGDPSPGFPLEVHGGIGYVVSIEKEDVSNTAYVRFMRQGAFVGSITETGGTTSYNAFTGSHIARYGGDLEMAYLVSLTGTNTKSNNLTLSEPVYDVEITAKENDSNVLGAYLHDFTEDSVMSVDKKMIMAVGNGYMWVIDDGRDLKVGDYLISSSVKGHAMLDNKNHSDSYIIGRVAENVFWADETNRIGGIKHKLVSVFFENFTINNETHLLKKKLDEYEIKASSNNYEINLLKAELAEIKSLLGVEAKKE